MTSVYQCAEWEAFVKNIRANPDEDTLRLVAADWLDEMGEGPRAEVIRVQIELSRPFSRTCRGCGKRLAGDWVADGCPCNSPRGVNHDVVPAYVCTCDLCDLQATGSVRARPTDIERMRRRERQLLEGAEGDGGVWFDFGDSLRVLMRRGFAEVVECRAERWREAGRALVRREPISEVRLTDSGRYTGHLTEWTSPEWPGITFKARD